LVALFAVPALLVTAAVAGTAAPASASSLPVIYNFQTAVALSLADPTGSPPGSNDWSCKPSAAHPRPVVLVHGTFANRMNEWQALSPLLKNDGYCVFAPNVGGATPDSYIQASGPIEDSANELSSFIDQVLAATGASKVDIVGHSQGGLIPQYYVKHGGAPKVNALIGLAPSSHGSTLDGLSQLAGIYGVSAVLEAASPAIAEQVAGSAFLTALDANGDTVPGVKYTVIETKYDEIVTPYTSAFLSGPNVTNITLQDGCLLDGSDHIAVAYDHRALRDVENALDPTNTKPGLCTVVLPTIGG
jgi:triacylglycerol esterase/lipase EstA (alpha/beta hydrolase family)